MILIIGGTGYIGGRLSKAFDHAGIDHLIGSRQLIPEKSNYRFYDLSSLDSIKKSLIGIEKIIFAAGPSSADTYENCGCNLADLSREFENFLHSVSDSQVKEIIYISSIHVYGKNLIGSVDETIAPIPLLDYGRYHLVREKLLEEHAKVNDISFLSLRMSNGFGAPANSNKSCWNLLINNLARSLVSHGRFIFNSSSQISRDFFPLSIAENFLIELMSKSSPLPCKVLNFSMAHSLTLEEASLKTTRIFSSLTGKTSEIVFLNQNDENYPIKKGDNFEIKNSALLQVFNKKPFDKSILDQEIKKLLQHCIEEFG